MSLPGAKLACRGVWKLFGAGAETLSGKSERYRCDYGAAIASNLDAIAGELEIALQPRDVAPQVLFAETAGIDDVVVEAMQEKGGDPVCRQEVLCLL